MEDILDTIDDIYIDSKSYEQASLGQRFANYLIDYLVFLIFSWIIQQLLGVFLEFTDTLIEVQVSFTSILMEWLLSIILMLIYYIPMEYFLKGKTAGKFITGTRAITLTNERMDFQTTFVRTICRFIPFEPFSFLGEKPSGWHDSMSKTKVIVDKGWKSRW